MFSLSIILFLGCNTASKQYQQPIIGTWKLISGTTIKGEDTSFVDYTKGQQEMIKIIPLPIFRFYATI